MSIRALNGENLAKNTFDAMFRLPSWLKPSDSPFVIRTTHPSDDSGVALLSRHFAERDTIDERQALVYGIGRLSARVFDLNKWYAEQGMNRKIVCVKKQITKVNGRKAWVTDYYKLEVTV
jgi:hypothetical protein